MLACSSPDDGAADAGPTASQAAPTSSSSTTGAGASTTGEGVSGTLGSTASSAGGAVSTTGTTSTSLSGGASSSGTITGTTGSGGTDGSGAPLEELALAVVPGNATIGLEWPRIEGATSYNLYWSTAPGVTPVSGTLIGDVSRGYVHRSLSNGQTYYYVVTALLPDGESAASPEASATPTGEWVLERLGTGDFDDVLTGQPVPTVPIAQRFHILLIGEGYTSQALPIFHDDAGHVAARDNDVDRWVDLVFEIEPYRLFPEAFVVWYLASPSLTTIRDANPDTAFQVPLTLGAGLAQMARPEPSGPTSAALFAALAQHPYAPSAGQGTLRNFVASFLIYDPERGAASVSGLSTTLTHPEDNSMRIDSAFGLGHAHEFTHAFAGLWDEYLENDNSPRNWDETSNVVGTNVCTELPWAHLLEGSAINPDTAGLVGAFGTAGIGYHSELLCLLNGTHDNGEYYAQGAGSCSASSCTLRVEDRMCNFCRELTSYWIFARSGVLDRDTTGFQTWKDEYRSVFYERFGLQVPGMDFEGMLPQSNDVRNPEQGSQIFEACVP